MPKPLLSVSPVDMAEDEQRIADSYRKNWWIVLANALPLGAVAYQGDLKAIVATGFILVIMAIYGAEGRLFDLCIRLRRTNVLLSTKLQAEAYRDQSS